MTISNKPIKQVSAARGAVLSVTMRWTDRLIGVISTLILARLLVPADFGVTAMASVVVGLIDTLLDLGVNMALIQNRNASRADFDTAWTLRLLQAILAAALIGGGAPLAADYFHDERVTDVMRVMAVSVLVGGLDNIGVVAFQKNMEFGRDFRFFFLRRLAGFTVTLSLAFLLRSYWAMALGSLSGRIVGLGLSYWLHDFRPRLSLARFGALWSFSQWVLVRNLGHYSLTQLDKFLVGSRTNTTLLGGYSLADEVAAMPTGEVLAPLGRVLFPNFVQAAHDAERLRWMFSRALGVQTLVALPAGVGLAAVAPDAILLLLGEQWLTIIPLVQILALMNVFGALSHSGIHLLLALGKVRLQAIFTWVQLALLAGATLMVFPAADAEGIALIRLGIAAFGMIFFFGLVLYNVPAVRFTDYLAHSWRPLLATALMTAALSQTQPPPGLILPVRLAAAIGVGAFSYALSILLLWRITGCREGTESYLLDSLGLKKAVLTLLWVRRRPAPQGK
ncbi:lipopolysaccharide biosynthesis protein [Methylomagnum sp.]